MNIKIKNKIALVTGANRGIGKSIVESFISHGAKKVYLAVRNLESANDLITLYGDKVQAIAVDVSNHDSINKLASLTKDVEIVVNNAGVLISANPLSKHAEESLKKELAVNVFGLLRMAQAFAPILERNGETAFVQLNSVASIKNFSDFTTYSASKSAAYSITQGLKDSFSPKGIHVLSVHPGPIDTDMAHNAGMGEIAQPSNLVSEGIVKSLAKGDFHLFPDTIAKEFELAYKTYADSVIEAEAA